MGGDEDERDVWRGEKGGGGRGGIWRRSTRSGEREGEEEACP